MPGIADLIAAKGAPEAAADGEEPALGADVAAKPEKPAKAAAKEEPDLGVDETETPAKHVPLPHLLEQRAKRRAAEQERDAARAEAAAAKEQAKVLNELYGKFEKPHEQAKEDAAFAQAFWELREDPKVKEALAVIQKHYHGATKVTERTEKPAEAAPAADPRVEQLFAERVKDRAEGLLKEAKVRSELHGPIMAYVLEQKGLNPSKEAVLSAMNEYVTSQGWTRQFLRGGDAKRATPLGNPSGLNAGTPSKDKAEAPEKAKNLTQLLDQRRDKLRELVQQRMPQ